MRAAAIYAEFEEKFGKFKDTLAYGQEKQELDVCWPSRSLLNFSASIFKREE